MTRVKKQSIDKAVYYDIFNSFLNPAFLLDDKKNIVDLNQQALITHEYSSKDELIGKSLLELFDTSEHQRLNDHFINASNQKKTIRLEYILVTKNNERFPSELNINAVKNNKGLFTRADRGTVFLDEIGDMPLSIQAKLLRVIQERTFAPLGSEKPVSVDVRIIIATNKDLKEEVKKGNFREDLFYRVHVIPVELPLLKDKKEDIPPLVDHFIKKFASRSQRQIRSISSEALAVLRRYSFPGNVRELENAIEHAFVMCHTQTIGIEHLPASIVEQAEISRGPFLDERSEKQIIEESLQRHQGNRSLVAKELGMHRTTLWRKLKSLRIAC